MRRWLVITLWALAACTRTYDVVVIGGGTGRTVGWANETWIKQPD